MRLLADPARVAAVAFVSPSGQQPLRVVLTENMAIYAAVYRRDVATWIERILQGLR